MIVAGVDPGLGSLTIAGTDGVQVWLHDELSRPVKVGKRNSHEPVPEKVRDALAAIGPDLVVIEKVQLVSSQGASTQARFVGSMHLVNGIAVGLGIRTLLVPPQVWKRHYRLVRKDRDGKEDSRQLALQLFPNAAPSLARKKDHDRAEALLLANYGLTKEVA